MKDENKSPLPLTPEEISLQQLEYSRKQCQYLRFMAVCCAAILIILCISSVMFYQRFNAIYQDLVVINANMKEVSADLADLDLKLLSEHMLSTMESSEEAMNIVSDTLSQLDVDKLNESIRNLTKAIDPLIRLFGGLGGG